MRIIEMGCDIHNYVEVKENGQWHMLGDVFEDTFFKRASRSPYHGRNYHLFGFLAGVRDDTIPPLAEPRGVPQDASEEYKGIIEQWGIDGHTPSYFTLQELINYDYDQMITIEGIVSSESYRLIKEQGYTDTYSRGVGGAFVKRVENHEMDQIIEDEEAFLNRDNYYRNYLYNTFNARETSPYWLDRYAAAIKKYERNGEKEHISFYTLAEWKRPLREVISHFLECVRKIDKFAGDRDYNSVRFVFFFDN